jgi:NDP-sugar pyrophosphorylase family protein
MKVVILAGGFETRLSEETDLIPKPMIEIGGRFTLWYKKLSLVKELLKKDSKVKGRRI